MNIDNITFSETQKFKQWWIWLIILLLNALVLAALYFQFILEKPFGNNPIGNLGLIFLVVFVLLFTLFFLSMKLETKIDTSGVHVRFFPFHTKFKTFPWDKIEKIEVITYKPLSEYGGWGIRGFKDNKAYNVSGNKGFRIFFKDNKKLLVGTLKHEELNNIIY